MNNPGILQHFKTDKCEEFLCPLYKITLNKTVPLSKILECTFYHSDYDKRRRPFKEKQELQLEYACSVDTSLGELGCLNRIEYLFHPTEYRGRECSDKDKCKLPMCPYFHNQEEQVENKAFIKLVKKKNKPFLADFKAKKAKFDGVELPTTKEISPVPEVKQQITPKKFVRKVRETSEEMTQGDDYTQKIAEFESQAVKNEEEEKVPISHQSGQASKLNKNKEPFYPSKKNGNAQGSDDGDIVNKVEKALAVFQQNKNGIGEDANGQINQGIEQELEPDDNLDNLVHEQDPLKFREIGEDRSNNDDDTISIVQNSLNPQSSTHSQQNPDPGSGDFYYKKEVTLQENDKIEFKAFWQYTDDDMAHLANKYLCGFLNHKGGTLYLGIRNDGKAVGMPNDRYLIDQIKLTFDLVAKKFTPPVGPDLYSFNEHKLFSSRHGTYLGKLIVLSIQINPSPDQELYFNGEAQAIIRKAASCNILTPQAIKQEMKRRYKHSVIRDIMSVLKDSEFDQRMQLLSLEECEELTGILKSKYQLLKQVIKNKEGKQQNKNSE